MIKYSGGGTPLDGPEHHTDHQRAIVLPLGRVDHEESGLAGAMEQAGGGLFDPFE